VAFVRTDVSEEGTSIIRVERISELGKTAVTSNRSTPRRNISSQLLVTANVFHSAPILFTLTMKGILPSETSVLTRATELKIPEEKASHPSQYNDIV
jgi:hypothetical protein